MILPLASIDVQKKQSINTSPVPPEQSSCSSWLGRSCSVVDQGLNRIKSATLSIFESSVVTLESLLSDNNMIASTFRKLNAHVFKMLEVIAQKPQLFSSLSQTADSAVKTIDGIQVAADVHHFVHGDSSKDSSYKKQARFFGFVANATWSIMWIKEMGLASFSEATKFLGVLASGLAKVQVFSFVPKILNVLPRVRDNATLSKLASNIGEVRIFSFVEKLSLGRVCARAATLAYGFMAADSYQRLMLATEEHHKTSAALDLAHYLSELTLDAIVTAGVTNVMVLGVAGSVAITLGLSSFAYSLHNKEILAKTSA